jgi:hypothetical protein
MSLNNGARCELANENAAPCVFYVSSGEFRHPLLLLGEPVERLFCDRCYLRWFAGCWGRHHGTAIAEGR